MLLDMWIWCDETPRFDCEEFGEHAMRPESRIRMIDGDMNVEEGCGMQSAACVGYDMDAKHILMLFDTQRALRHLALAGIPPIYLAKSIECALIHEVAHIVLGHIWTSQGTTMLDGMAYRTNPLEREADAMMVAFGGPMCHMVVNTF